LSLVYGVQNYSFI